MIYLFEGETTGNHQYVGKDLDDCINQLSFDMELHDLKVTRRTLVDLELVHPSAQGDIFFDTLTWHKIELSDDPLSCNHCHEWQPETMRTIDANGQIITLSLCSTCNELSDQELLGNICPRCHGPITTPVYECHAEAYFCSDQCALEYGQGTEDQTPHGWAKIVRKIETWLHYLRGHFPITMTVNDELVSYWARDCGKDGDKLYIDTADGQLIDIPWKDISSLLITRS